VRAQLEGVMFEVNLRAELARGFIEGGNLEVAVRSGVIREDVQGHHPSII
jgi:hypothetical protein